MAKGMREIEYAELNTQVIVMYDTKTKYTYVKLRNLCWTISPKKMASIADDVVRYVYSSFKSKKKQDILTNPYHFGEVFREHIIIEAVTKWLKQP